MLSLVATIALNALPACGAVDLDTALALIANHSNEVAIKRSEAAAAEADLALAKAARWAPEATLTITSGLSPEARGTFPNQNVQGSSRGLGNVGVFGRADLTVVQPLYTFGRLDAARDAATAGIQARKLLVDETLAQLELRVRKLYWGEALARRGLDILGEVEKALQEVDQTLQEMLKKKDPSVSTQDRYRVEVFRSELRGKQAEARKGLDQAHLALAATLGTNPERLTVKPVPLPLEEGELPAMDVVRESATKRRLDLAALDQAILAKQAEVRAQEGAYKPQFFIAGKFEYGRATNRDIQNNPWVSDPFNAYTIGALIGIRQDLAFPMLVAKADKVRAELATLEEQRAGLARLVNTEVEGAVYELKAARERLIAAKASRDAARSLFRSATLDFAMGLQEAKVLLDAYRDYMTNQWGLVNAAYDLIVARAQLSKVSGENRERGTAQCELS